MGYRGYLSNPKDTSDTVCLGKLYGYCESYDDYESQCGLAYLHDIGKGADDDMIICYCGHHDIILTQEEARDFIFGYTVDGNAEYDGEYVDGANDPEINDFIDKHEEILLEGV